MQQLITTYFFIILFSTYHRNYIWKKQYLSDLFALERKREIKSTTRERQSQVAMSIRNYSPVAIDDTDTRYYYHTYHNHAYHHINTFTFHIITFLWPKIHEFRHKIRKLFISKTLL
ncbi:hypothetical protein V1478_001747 [Vespula squamosa]|uniref:Uncharacterized protein n=1 Tax=Vespula squamosa TaxID=30214 RepID=A0ABD2BY07_VESSQ